MIAVECENAGEQAKGTALGCHEIRHRERLRLARIAFVHALLAKGSATIDDARNGLPLAAIGHNPRWLGALPGWLARLGICQADGFTKSNRPAAHARPVQLWTLADAGLAREWLAVNIYKASC